MKRIVVIGGGTGNYTVLKSLAGSPFHLSAIVTMADDGGSTGILRDELGVLPPGDVRQCLVALSESSELMRDLMNYRFDNGGLQGHSFGNILLSALEKVTGSFEKAVEEAGKILAIKGQVIPVTTHIVRLKMGLKSGEVLEGEKEIYLSKKIDQGYNSLRLEPTPRANPHAIEAIENADLIILGPGGVHTALIPNLLVEGISEAICRSPAKKLFIVNLVNQRGQTTGYRIKDYVEEISRFLGADPFDHILVNNQIPPEELVAAYAVQGELVSTETTDPRVILAPLLGNLTENFDKDLIKRSLIRHERSRLAKEIIGIAMNNIEEAVPTC